jgi:hypothetical protein
VLLLVGIAEASAAAENVADGTPRFDNRDFDNRDFDNRDFDIGQLAMVGSSPNRLKYLPR